jgi:hypothetical protein
MLHLAVKNLLGKNNQNNKDGENSDSSTGEVQQEQEQRPPFTFVWKDTNGEEDTYPYPSLYDEAEEMLKLSLLIYSITDLRSLAKNPKKAEALKTPEKILDLPLSLHTCLEMLEENYDVVKAEFGDAEHENTMSSLQAIHARYQKFADTAAAAAASSSSCASTTTSTTSFTDQWFRPFAKNNPFNTATEENSDDEDGTKLTAELTAFGDENSESDMVYAVGIDPIRKRVTVAFRGSVTRKFYVSTR